MVIQSRVLHEMEGPTIADRNSGKRKPEVELPIQMTLVQGVLGRNKAEADKADISSVEGEIASSFLVAIHTPRDRDGRLGRPSEAGAHDYSIDLLPFDELIARVCAALKRTHIANREEILFRVGDLHLDASRHLVQKKGRPLHLTPKEFALLHNLMMNVGKTVSHRKLLRLVWGPEHGSDREYLRIFVRQLRLKIEDNPANPKYLLTEPRIGYRFAETVEGDDEL
jgi:DNA-binding response OmpR family regulator